MVVEKSCAAFSFRNSGEVKLTPKPNGWTIPKDQAGAWQLISININRKCSAAASLIVNRSWRSEDRCAAVLIGAVLIMAVSALDCKKDWDVFETFILR